MTVLLTSAIHVGQVHTYDYYDRNQTTRESAQQLHAAIERKDPYTVKTLLQSASATSLIFAETGGHYEEKNALEMALAADANESLLSTILENIPKDAQWEPDIASCIILAAKKDSCSRLRALTKFAGDHNYSQNIRQITNGLLEGEREEIAPAQLEVVLTFLEPLRIKPRRKRRFFDRCNIL